MSESSAPVTGAEGTPDTGTNGPNSEQNQGTPDTGTTGPDTTNWRAEAEKFEALAKKHERQAKENIAAAKELARVRREAMTDQERAVAEAVEKAKAEAFTESASRFGARLVAADIKASAAGRLSAEQIDALTARLDVSGFLTADGEVNAGAITEFVESIAPAPAPGQTGFPDLGQGARGPAPLPLNGDPLERDLKSKLGIR
jgi:hypothetical protein